MLHNLQQELNTLLYIYFNSKGLLHLGNDCSELVLELKNCMDRIKAIFEELESDEETHSKINHEDWTDADEFFEWICDF